MYAYSNVLGVCIFKSNMYEYSNIQDVRIFKYTRCMPIQSLVSPSGDKLVANIVTNCSIAVERIMSVAGMLG